MSPNAAYGDHQKDDSITDEYIDEEEFIQTIEDDEDDIDSAIFLDPAQNQEGRTYADGFDERKALKERMAQ